MARSTNECRRVSYHAAFKRPCIQLLIFVEDYKKIFYQLATVQALTYRRRDMFAVPESQGTSKFICKPLILDEKQLFFKQA